MIRPLLFFAALILAGTGVSSAEPVARDADDEIVERAVRTSLLGNAPMVGIIAREREGVEAQRRAAGMKPRLLSNNIAMLAAATERPIMTPGEGRELLRRYRTDPQAEAVERLLRVIEPRERFRNARADRQYEQRRRVVNSVTNGIAGALQLQLFALIQVPLDAVDHLLIGRKYATPEQRRELYEARVAEREGRQPRDAASGEAIRLLTSRRAALARLQADRNADRAAESGRLDTAEWWLERAMLLQSDDAEVLARMRALQARREAVEQNRLRSVSVLPGEETLREPDLFLRYSALVRTFIADPSSPEIRTMVREIRVAYPLTTARDTLSLAEAVHHKSAGDMALARWELGTLASPGQGGLAHAAAVYLARPEFTPDVAFERAHRAIRQRQRAFVFAGRDPSLSRRMLTPEQARAVESGWITGARSLFVFDIIGRAIIYPFLPARAFPREELYDAVRESPAAWRATAQGRARLAEAASALDAERRHGEAAALWTEIGNRARAERSRQRAAARLERQARETPRAVDRIALYERVLTGYPSYANIERVRTMLGGARLNTEIIAEVSREELRQYSFLWNEEGLGLPPTLFDGNARNGEVSRRGIELLSDNRAVYYDEQAGRRIEVPVADGRVETTLRRLMPLRRLRDLNLELDRPRARKRLPIEIEGSALPGFGIAPGLVPLELDERERRLYE